MHLDDQDRLAALAGTKLLDSPAQASFDRLTRLAMSVLNVPVSLVTLVDADRQFFLSCAGLPEPWQSARQTPLSHSFCQHVVTTGAALVVEDAREDMQLKDNLAIADLDVVAYLGIPLKAAGNQLLGSFCVIDSRARAWTAQEIDIVEQMAEMAAAEIELHLVKQQVADRLSRYEALLDSVADGIYALDMNGLCNYANTSFCQMFGYDLEELIGRDVHLLTHHTRGDGSCYPREQCPIARTLAGGGDVLVDEEVMWCKNGNSLPVEYAARPFTVDDQVVGVAVRVTDIAKRKSREDEIALQQALLAAQAESLLDAMLIVDPDGTALWVNRRFAEMWQFPDELLASGSDVRLREWAATQVANPDGFDERIQQIYADRLTPARDEIVMRDGRVYDRYGGPVLSEAGEYFGHLWLFREITEAKWAAEERERLLANEKRLREKLEVALQDREEMLAIVSHDLRNPFATVFTAASVLLDMPLDEPQRKQQLEIIQRTANTGTRLIQNLLDASRISAGNLTLERRKVDVAALLAEAAELAGGAASEGGVVITTVPPAPDTTIKADRDRLLQVFSNLIGNAVRFTPAGGRIVLSAQAEADGVRFSVEDNGSGISSEALPHLFDRDWQARQARRAGAGLGLSIVRGIVRAHGGEVAVHSEMGRGSRFEFVISNEAGQRG